VVLATWRLVHCAPGGAVIMFLGGWVELNILFYNSDWRPGGTFDPMYLLIN